jgi:hypothetical protein
MRDDVMRRGIFGVIAGAAGTMALHMTTYGDMLLRGRGASNVPATLAGKLANVAGLSLLSSRGSDERSENRRQAAGALLGYGSGLVIGGLYGLTRGDQRSTGSLLPGVAVGLLAMAASDLPIAVTGVSDPRQWTPVDWASDVIPHLVYGLIVVGTFDAIAQRSDSQR